MSDSPAPAVRWSVGETLERHRLTPEDLARTTGLPSATVHAVASGRARGVQLETLTLLARGLEELTGEAPRPEELLEVARGDGAAPAGGWQQGSPGDAGP